MAPLVKILVVLSLMVLSQATPAYEYPYYVNTGTSKQYRTQDEDGSYQFGYDEDHSSGGTFRKETGDAFGNKYGSYGLTDADGRYRVVNYIADEAGFRVDIKTNEPGTVPADPASTTVNKAAFLVAPVVTGVKTAPAGAGVKGSHAGTGIKGSPAGTGVKGSPAGIKTVAAFSPVKAAPVSTGFPAFPAFPNSLFYAPDIHHAATPEFPLLYRNQFATYGNYKGSPYTNYRGSPYASYKGSPYTSRVFNTYKGSPYVARPYPKYGYYVYP